MKCAICKNGETHFGYTTVTLERNENIIVFKQVPAQICNNCGEYYLDENISKQLLNQAEDSISQGAEFEVRKLKMAS